MRIKLLAAAAVAILLVATAAVITSCQDGATEPTGPIEMRTGEPGIEGYVRDAISKEAIDGAYVQWFCDTCACTLGDNVVDEHGYYYIDPEDPFNWETHDGHDMHGEATHPAYNTGYQDIDDFDPGSIPYTRNFDLVPGK